MKCATLVWTGCSGLRGHARGISTWMSTPSPLRHSGGEADVGVLRHRAGHADLGAALAQDGQLRPSVHAAAGQRGVPLLLQVHRKVLVHRPAAPFPLDFRLHLQVETSQRHFFFLVDVRLHLLPHLRLLHLHTLTPSPFTLRSRPNLCFLCRLAARAGFWFGQTDIQRIFREKTAHLSVQEAVKNGHHEALRRRRKGWI